MYYMQLENIKLPEMPGWIYVLLKFSVSYGSW